MPSTYTVNLGIEKPATGEQSGTWGDTTNVNFDILDQAINGAERVTLTSAGSSGSPNALNITNGATSDGRNKWIEFYSSGDLGGSVYVQLVPNDAEKIVFVRNSLASSRSILLFQGTYNSGRDLEIPAGVDMVVKFDGGGASAATVTDVYTNLKVTGLVAGTADINGGTVDGTVIGGASAAALTATTVVANTSLNIAGDGATVTGIKDEDNMASNSATKLATQQSIKAYVDSQVGTVDTLAEILANGNETGSNDIDVDGAQKVAFRDAAIYIHSSTDGQLDIVADTEIQLAATTIDINGAIVASGDIAAASLDISGNVDIDGTLNVDAIDIDGAVQLDATLTVGVDDTGYDVKFYGATGGAYMLWDESADDLILAGAAGLVVAGNVDFNGDLDVDGTTNLDVVDIDGAVDMASTLAVADTTTIEKTASGVTKALKLYNNTAGANNRVAIDFHTANTLYGTIEAGYGATAPEMNFIVSSVDNLKLSTSGAVFNESSADIDFRVESDGSTHMLYVDAGTNRIGINNPSPAYKLDILGGSGDQLRLNNGGERFTQMYFQTNGSNKGAIWADDTDASFAFYGYLGIDANFYSNAQKKFSLRSDSVVVNEDSHDVDFRVESNSNSHMLFVDGGNDRVGIGVDAPSDVLQVHSGAAGRSIFRHASGDGGVTITGTGAGSAASLVFGNNWDNDAGSNFVEEYRLFMDGADDSLKFNYNANSSTALTLSSSGAATFSSSVTATKGIFTQAGGDFAAVFTTPFDYVAKFESTDSAAFIVLEDVNSTDNANRIGAVGDSIQIESGNVENALFTSTASVFNENSADMDFRVESDGNANMLFVDGGNDRVAIGGTGYTNDTDLNLLGAGLSIKNDKDGSNNNWSLIQNTATGGASNLKFTLGTGNIEFGHGGEIITNTVAGYHTVFNEGGVDSDFRVETNNKPNAFRIDGGDDQVRTDAVFVHDADGSNQPFYITRSGGLDQGLKVTVDDNNVMLTSVQDETSGANFVFYSTNATTTNLNMLQLDYSAGSVFNEGGVNYQHVRMESDADTHAFYLNAVNGYIGIGAGASPVQPLTIGASSGSNLNYYSGTTNVISSGSGIKVSKAIANDAAAGSGLNLSNTSSTDGTMSPMLHFSALSASTTYSTTYAGIWGRKRSSGTDNNWNTGSIEFGTAHSAGINKRMELDYQGGLITTPLGGGHAVFNEDSADADFRVESDGVSNMLHVDGGSNGIGIRVLGDGNQSLKIKSTGATGNLTLIEDESVGDGSYTPYYQYKVAYIAGNSSNTQLTIPFNARSYNQTGYIKVRVLPALHNLATASRVATFEFALTMAYPTTVSVNSVLSSSGNYASVTNNTSNQIIVTFTSNYSNATMSGAFIHVEFFGQQGTAGAPDWNNIAFN